ncbi:hypothetical protein L313_1569 [Acinetobacter haemolyticus CIP 64.3 = MTCC 9819]|uniref:Uncharacterized protein n=1 Tax=Acinetobacter haemolyticus CIP 64.3 = MTCC 9819 TaxID=1217659 RepID=N9GJX7_ACIHA|nr:hypothetical protein [Acinetobacter haemolyticus]ENW17424.1 hypothetical protein F927_02134 [Acinetobacter haemolyticus CIP 64.3 = MTCC 9819]EPR89237.1 hypothetical protein L313_1569 [Acinetobacter haemolyticus CIP 64.3 = MTCC 9819]QXZ26418.1 hypothetical protein I6L22_14775 [Acinetobacter haemolyticus]SPT46560.1 Uncharacterised protein [Acinetobacter haemolyticus]SUU61602.1 Uncharacterised protein [Acinetobacter haemolyticus]
MQKLKPASLVALIIGIVIVVVGAYLLNQHQQRQTDLQLAQLALEQSKVQNQTTDIAQAASEPIEHGLSGIEGLTEDRANQTAHLEVSPDDVAGALEAVAQAKATTQSKKKVTSGLIAYGDLPNALQEQLHWLNLKMMEQFAAQFNTRIGVVGTDEGQAFIINEQTPDIIYENNFYLENGTCRKAEAGFNRQTGQATAIEFYPCS